MFNLALSSDVDSPCRANRGRGEFQKLPLDCEFEFSMSDSSARRGAHTDTPGAPSRIRLGKQQWQDIRRACRLGDESGLHSVELHGVRVTFRFQKTCQGPAQDKAVPRPAQAGRTTGGSSANAQRSPTPPARPQDNQRPRRKARLLLPCTQHGGSIRWPPPLTARPSARSNTARRRAARNVAVDHSDG